MNLLLVFSCSDPCDSVYCVPEQGECFDGDCLCQIQYDTLANGDTIKRYWGGDSCNIDLCAKTPCVNGDCIWGNCECAPGYDGDSCDYLLRAPYIDSFQVSDICSSHDTFKTTYTSYIVADTLSLDFVYICNVYYDSTSTKIRAHVSEFGLEIDPSPQQITVGANTYTISGTSSPYDSISYNMSFIYSVTDNNGNVDTCSSLFSKF